MGPGDLGSGLPAVALFLRNRILLYDLKYKLSGLNIPGAGITGAPTHPLKTVFQKKNGPLHVNGLSQGSPCSVGTWPPFRLCFSDIEVAHSMGGVGELKAQILSV